ncbi:hypothetical protein [Beduinella massiliensis]|uniref:hypothetical protein n=1 Tax=Beduinella massiliensis TaxID=1852363 RepID=UPI0031F955A4
MIGRIMAESPLSIILTVLTPSIHRLKPAFLRALQILMQFSSVSHLPSGVRPVIIKSRMEPAVGRAPRGGMFFKSPSARG